MAGSDLLMVPEDPAVRLRLRTEVEAYAAAQAFVPPLREEELILHAEAFLLTHGEFLSCRKLILILLNNAAWSGVMSAIPWERRILLLPKCFRTEGQCGAPVDEFGVLCRQCGACLTGELIAEAEALGIQVLVSEGTTTVVQLLSSGQVEAVIGVGCLESLEKSWPLVFRKAVPAQAVPLLKAGCSGAMIDRHWLTDVLAQRSTDRWRGGFRIDELREEVSSWFTRDALDRCLAGLSGVDLDPTRELALEWLTRGGKYWRPLLLSALVHAAPERREEEGVVVRLSMAIECFHKASLLHDDIEDGDPLRYGQATFYREHGVGVALNTGDYLIGLGYHLIACCGADPQRVALLLKVATRAHLELCRGQGQELLATEQGYIPAVPEMLMLYRQKTAPAFGVALLMGAMLTGASQEILTALEKFSAAIGTAYQIKDDIDDLYLSTTDDLSAGRPTLLLALAQAREPEKVLELWSRVQKGEGAAVNALRQLILEGGDRETAEALCLRLRREALEALAPLTDPAVKSLLFRLTDRILGGETARVEVPL